MKVNIREAAMKDFEQVSELCQELIGNPLDERIIYFKRALSSKNYIPLVVEIEGDIVGFLDIWSFPDVGHGGTLGIIANFIVTKKYRESGIGNKLMEESVKMARKEKFIEFHVWTEFKNENAIKIYKKHGFTNESLLLEKEFH